MSQQVTTSAPELAAPSAGRLPCFDGLRAIAAVSILVYHVTLNLLPTAAASPVLLKVLLQLRSGVWIFFVLSGYLLYRPHARAHAAGMPAPSTREYLRNRALRILPAYWVALFIVVYVADQQPMSFGDFVAHAFLLQIYKVQWLPGGIGPAWSLAVEASFYLVLPLYALGVGRLTRAVGVWAAEWLGLAVLVVVGVGWQIGTRGTLIQCAWLPGFLPVFAVGIAFAVIAARADDARGLVGRACHGLGRVPSLCWLLAVLALYGKYHQHPMEAFANGLSFGPQAWFTLFAGFLVLPAVFGAQDRGGVRWFLRTRPVAYLGLIGYGIFLWHVPVIQGVMERWSENGIFGWHTPVLADLHVPGLASVLDRWTTGSRFAVPPLLEANLLTLAITVVIATLSWYLVERPALSLKRTSFARG